MYCQLYSVCIYVCCVQNKRLLTYLLTYLNVPFAVEVTINCILQYRIKYHLRFEQSCLNNTSNDSNMSIVIQHI